MVGFANADNKFGLSPFIVGTTLGDGCNYISIQSAFNDAIAAGGGVIYIRPGTYTENLVFSGSMNISLVGAEADGRLGQVLINGNQFFDGFGTLKMANLNFDVAAGDTILAQGNGGTLFFVLDTCQVTSAAGKAIVTDTFGGGDKINTLFEDLLVFSATNCIESAGFTDHLIQGGFYNSGTDAFSFIGGTFSQTRGAKISATNKGIIIGPGGLSTFVFGTNIICGDEAFDNGLGNTLEINDCVIQSSAASGNFVIGAGVLKHIDIALTGSAINNGAAATLYNDWKPYGLSGAGPGTFRGTAAFDSAQFLVTDGFVQLVGGPSGIVWTDYAASTGVSSFSGSNATALIVLSLPIAPANGDVCDFLASTASTLTIQATGAQKIQIGNTASSAGGTAASNDIGDSLHLVYMLSSDTWWSIGGSEGNWTLA